MKFVICVLALFAVTHSKPITIRWPQGADNAKIQQIFQDITNCIRETPTARPWELSRCLPIAQTGETEKAKAQQNPQAYSDCISEKGPWDTSCISFLLPQPETDSTDALVQELAQLETAQKQQNPFERFFRNFPQDKTETKAEEQRFQIRWPQEMSNAQMDDSARAQILRQFFRDSFCSSVANEMKSEKLAKAAQSSSIFGGFLDGVRRGIGRALERFCNNPTDAQSDDAAAEFLRFDIGK